MQWRKRWEAWASGPDAPPIVAMIIAMMVIMVVALYVVYALQTGHA